MKWSPFRPLGLFGALALLGACAGVGQLTHGVYSKGSVRYRIGELPAGWQQVRLEGNDLAFLSKGSGHSLAINATCEDTDDPTLPVLTRHLLMGFTARTTLDEQTVTLDGREGLRSHVTARLDGVPVELLLLVLKKNGCVYDFTYLSPQGKFEEQRSAFEGLVAGFQVEARP